MRQIEIFPADPPVPAYEHGGYIPPAKSDRECEKAVLAALRLYQDDNDMGWMPETVFDALKIGQMASCQASGPFCIAFLPAFLPYGVVQIYRALQQLVRGGEVIEDRKYFGSRTPDEGNYRGYGYIYSLPDIEVS